MPLYPLPEAFLNRMRKSLQSQYTAFIDSLSAQQPTSLRINPRKYTNKFDNCPAVPWCKEGRYLPERPQFVADPCIFAGAYYVQEASSMFLAHALTTLLDLDDNLSVLDLCAAPGGKSTLISSLITNESLLVSNELVGKRVPALIENITRWGNANSVITNNNVKDFAPLIDFFDVIVADAPCSGEGMFRKDIKAVQQWSEQLVKSCAVTQRQIIEQIMPTLKPGGLFVFSTCTFAPEEDEQNIVKLLSDENLLPMRIPYPAEWGIEEVMVTHNGREGYGYRFMPHITVGEGFFLTCFQKDGERDFSTRRHKTKKGNKFDLLPKKYFPTVYPYFENPTELDFLVENDRLFVFPSSITDDIRLLKSVLNVRMNGIEAGIWKNEKLLPDHHLAVATITSLQLPEVSLNYEQAIQYLQKKEIQQLHTETLKGWLIVKYDNHRLGWINVLSNRINNYYPMDSRIRKEFVPV